MRQQNWLKLTLMMSVQSSLNNMIISPFGKIKLQIGQLLRLPVELDRQRKTLGWIYWFLKAFLSDYWDSTHKVCKQYQDKNNHYKPVSFTQKIPITFWHVASPKIWLPLIQNDRWPLSRLPGDSSLAGLPAAPQADKGQAKPGAQELWLRRGQCLQTKVLKYFMEDSKTNVKSNTNFNNF